MATIKAIYIPADSAEDVYVQHIERDDYRKIQELVGGSFEVLNVNDPPCSLYFNEEGRIKELPENERATLLLRVMRPEFITESPLLGDVLLVGAPDGDGNDTSAPETLVSIILGGRRVAIEFQRGEGKPYKRMESTFDNYLLGYMMALYALNRYHSITGIRVVML